MGQVKGSSGLGVYLVYLGAACNKDGERETEDVVGDFEPESPNSLLAVDLVERREAEVEEPPDLTGFCVCELCGWGRLMHASTRILDGLSIYFSIKRSLFQDICRKSRLAVVPCQRRYERHTKEATTYLDSKNVTDILHVLSHLFLDLCLAQRAVINLVGLTHRLRSDFEVVTVCVHVHLIVRNCINAVN